MYLENLCYIVSDIESFCFSDNKLQEELLRTTQLVYSYKDGKGMVSSDI